MATVVASMTMSLDGFIAYEDDTVGHLFDWYDAGSTDVAWPGSDMVSHVTDPSATYLEDLIAGVGALVVGRHLYDCVDGWGGSHPFGVPLFLVTHRPPASWPSPDAPFTAVPEGVAAAVARAAEVAGHRAVALGGADVIRQGLALGLVDEVGIDLAPVLLGHGVRLFGDRPGDPVLLEDPVVVEGRRVTHLRYRVRRPS